MIITSGGGFWNIFPLFSSWCLLVDTTNKTMQIYFKSLHQTWLFIKKNPAFIFWKLSKSSTVLPLIVFRISKPFRKYKNKRTGVYMLRWYLCYLMKKLHVNNWIKPKFMAVCFKRISGKVLGRCLVGHVPSIIELIGASFEKVLRTLWVEVRKGFGVQ